MNKTIGIQRSDLGLVYTVHDCFCDRCASQVNKAIADYVGGTQWLITQRTEAAFTVTAKTGYVFDGLRLVRDLISAEETPAAYREGEKSGRACLEAEIRTLSAGGNATYPVPQAVHILAAVEADVRRKVYQEIREKLSEGEQS